MDVGLRLKNNKVYVSKPTRVREAMSAFDSRQKRTLPKPGTAVRFGTQRAVIDLAKSAKRVQAQSSPTARHCLQASVAERPIALPPATGGSHVRHRYRPFPYRHRKVRVQGRDCAKSRNGKSLALCG